MANKMDGVKISVNNNDADSKEVKEEAKKKPAPKTKKAPVKRKAPVRKKPVKKTEVKNEKKIVSKAETKKAETKRVEPSKSTKPKKKKSFLSILFSVLLTASFVGGAMYFWQNKAIEKVEEEAQGETETVKTDLEKRLSNLKSKVTGVETKNVELKKTLEEFKKKAELLIGAKKEFDNQEFGFSFEYPASFGTINVSTSTKASSTMYEFGFENNKKLILSGVEDSYEKQSTSSAVSLKELKGFIERGKKLYVLGPNDSQEYEVNPAQIIEFNGGEAILIDKNSFVLEEGGDGLPVEIGDDVAFVVNLKDKKIPGLTIVNSDFGMMNLNDFVLMIESFEIK